MIRDLNPVSRAEQANALTSMLIGICYLTCYISISKNFKSVRDTKILRKYNFHILIKNIISIPFLIKETEYCCNYLIIGYNIFTLNDI